MRLVAVVSVISLLERGLEAGGMEDAPVLCSDLEELKSGRTSGQEVGLAGCWEGTIGWVGSGTWIRER